MNHPTALITGLLTTFGSTELTDSIDFLNSNVLYPSELLQIQSNSELDYLIKCLISLLGGILSTIIIAFLKKKFPEYFAERRRKRLYKRK